MQPLVMFEHIHGGSVEKLTDLLRVKEAAEFLGISPNTLRNWSRDGKIAVHRKVQKEKALLVRRALVVALQPT